MEDGSDLPVTVLNSKPRLHQFSGCPQLHPTGQGAEGGLWPARSGLLQACDFPGGRSAGSAPDRGGAEDVPHRPGRCALPRWRAPTPAPAVPTGCRPSATGSPCPMSAMSLPQSSSSTRCPTASSPPAMSRKRWQSLPARRRATTTWSPSTRPTSPTPWSTSRSMASPSSRAATSWPSTPTPC